MTQKVTTIRQLMLNFACVACCYSTALGQDATTQKSIAPRSVTLITADQWQIPVTYFPSPKDRDSPVVLLMHNRLSSRQVWKNGFAERLQSLGYAVISVDLRKHGESRGPNAESKAEKASDLKGRDYKAMVAGDLEAVKKFIYEEHQKQNLNMRKMGIVAPEMSAPLAVGFAWRDWLKKPHNDGLTLQTSTPRGQDVRALALISPEYQIKGFGSCNGALKMLRRREAGVAFLTVWGENDRLDEGDSQKFYDKLIGGKNEPKRFYRKTYGSDLRGTDLFSQQSDLQEQLVAFLRIHLFELPDPWINRQNKLFRDPE